MTFVLIALGVAILMAWPRTGFEDFLSLNRIGTKNGVIHPSPTPNTPTTNLAVSRVKCIWETDNG